MPLLRRLPAAAVSAAVFATSLVTTGVSASAQAVTPPPDACSTGNAELRYLVLLEPGNAQLLQRWLSALRGANVRIRVP